jgi:hypothetical protein
MFLLHAAAAVVGELTFDTLLVPAEGAARGRAGFIGVHPRLKSSSRWTVPGSQQERLNEAKMASGHKGGTPSPRRLGRTFFRLFAFLSADVTWISGERSFAPTAYRLRPVFSVSSVTLW